MKNKKSVKDILLLLLGSVLILAIGYIFFLLINFLFAELQKLNPNVSASIIAGLFATGVALFTQNQIRKRDIAESHRDKKTELYKNYLQIIFDLIDKEGKLKDLPPDQLPTEIKDSMRNFIRDLIVWGSSDVVSKYEECIESAAEKDNRNILFFVDDVIQAMRKDLGIGNSGLNRGALVKLLLKNPKELDDLLKK